MPFFNPVVLQSKQSMSTIPKCGKCQLYKGCMSPKMEPSGKGRKRILIVGEASGQTEDEQGKQFVGKSGQLLESFLYEVGIDMRKDCWIINALSCRPPDNRTPSKKEIEFCRPLVFNAIRKFDPDVILTLGIVPIKSVIGHVWRENVDKMSRWSGFKIPSRNPNAWIVPTFHPAYVARQNDPVLDLYFRRHLEVVASIEGKPWDKIESYDDKIQCIISPKEAAAKLRQFIANKPSLIAFDYETDRLKPDHKDARIMTCSVSDGETTLAYPWHGPTIEITRQILMDKTIGKVASNMRFEQRWTMKEFGKGVRGWAWDTVLAAHIIDNRRKITGLKFQSYVNMGQPSYDDHLAPYLKAKGSNQENRIKELDLKSLLLYNGVDSASAIELALKQMKELGSDAARCTLV